MKNKILKTIAGLLALFSFAAWLNAQEPIPPFMGDWQGGWVNAPKEDGNAQRNPGLVARVIGLGGDRYEIQLMEEFDKRANYLVRVQASWENGKLAFDAHGFKGEITSSQFTGKKRSEDRVTSFALQRLHRKSPTLGAKPPADAVILFDGSNLDTWRRAKGEPVTWLIKDGFFEVLPRKENNDKGGSIYTRQSFGDCKVHLEFKLPYEPEGRGQHRGNSGFFLPGGYEVQILDSYGLGGLWNECGALYKQSPPQVNMCWAPGVWQTFDVEFERMRMDAEGDKIDDAVITVWHNGKLIQNQVRMKGTTSNTQVGRRKPQSGKRGSLQLQDHSHKIQFRNIWVEQL